MDLVFRTGMRCEARGTRATLTAATDNRTGLHFLPYGKDLANNERAHWPYGAHLAFQAQMRHEPQAGGPARQLQSATGTLAPCRRPTAPSFPRGGGTRWSYTPQRITAPPHHQPARVPARLEHPVVGPRARLPKTLVNTTRKCRKA